MKKYILIIFLFSSLFFNPFLKNEMFGQSTTVTIQYGGYTTECCSANTISYFCFNSPNNTGYCGQTTMCNTQSFFDPVPAGNIVTQISVSYFSAGCAGGNMQGTLNGTSIGTVAETNSGCACTGVWFSNGSTTANFPCGITNSGYTYNYGGNNSFQFCALTGQICIDRAVLTISYAPANQANPASQPSAISGNAAVCTGVANTYSIPAVANASGYTWTVPAGWVINSGQGSTSITATPGSAGNICVTASNLCGTSASTCTPITISTVSTAPTSATATPNSICSGSSTTLSVSGGALGVGANWNWYSGSCGGPFVGSGSSILVSPGSTTTYYVRAQGTCNTTSCVSTTVTVNPTVTASWTNPSNICAAAGSINLNSLITGTTGGTWSGTGVSGSSFNPASGTQSVTYTVGLAPCTQTSIQTITVVPDVNPAWTNPSNICAASGNINLTSLITGTAGGIWSGTGVSGTTFNPASGTQSVTYTVGTAPCQETSVQTITVNPDVDPSWTNPSPICAASGNINLTSLITGTAGGTWSGTGVSGTTFNPASGTQSVTYTVGTAPCVETSIQTITVSAVDPSWTNPSPICEGSSPVNLNTLVTGSAGGTFSGTGVSSNNFDPAGLGGTVVNITYTVGASPCTEILAQNITVDSTPIITIPSGGTVCVGNTLSLTPSSGGTWISSDPTVATIDNSGLVTGITAGTANMVFTDATTGCSSAIASGVITVNPIPVLTIPSGGGVCVGNTLNLTPSSGGTWISSDPTVATIDNSGLVTGITAGTANMVFTDATTGCSSTAASGTITVNPLPIVTVPSGGLVCIGSTINLTPSSGGTWLSSDPTVATIDNSGLVSGMAIGTANMVFTDATTGCSNTIASGVVTVNPIPVVTVPSGGVVCVGDTITLIPSSGGTWISSDPTVATIDNTGLVTGVSSGTADMVFTDATTGCSSLAASGTIIVNPQPVITVPSGGVLCAADTLSLIPSSGGTWLSSNPAVATIDNTGLVTGVSSGTANMVFTDATTGCSSIAASGIITVNPTPIVTMPSGGSICIGSAINLTPSLSGTWVSSDPAVATVDNTGLVTGITAGTSNMVFTDATTGCSNTAASGAIIVDPRPVINVPSGGLLCFGDTLSLAPSSGGIWSSSDPAVATIDNTGIITGVSVGTANMVYIDSTTGCSSITASGLITVGGVTASIGATPSSGLVPLEVTFTNGSTTGPTITYTWNFGNGSSSNVFEPSQIYADIGSYVATLIVSDGLCIDSASVIIEVLGVSSIIIPNVFTPNGDGQNDVFTVDGTNLKSVEAEIFNRWGQKMFAWKHVKGYWDGRTQSGSEAPDATYFYIISATGMDGEEYFKKGGFSLIR